MSVPSRRSARRFLLLGLAVLVVAPGCRLSHLRFLVQGERGDGKIVTQTREVTPFTAIRVSHSLEMTYRPADRVQVVVEGDSNLLQYIRTDVEKGCLVAAVVDDQSISPTQAIRVRVEGPAVQALDASGASRLDATLEGASSPIAIEASGASRLNVVGIDGTDLTLSASGASQVDVAGRAAKLVLEASGASHVNAGQLEAETALVDVSGASNAALHVHQRVEGEASGASRVQLVGTPASEAIALSGASSVGRQAEGATR